jgi:hypothetical protein
MRLGPIGRLPSQFALVAARDSARMRPNEGTDKGTRIFEPVRTQHIAVKQAHGRDILRWIGTAYRIRTDDLRLERAVSWASRRMRRRCRHEGRTVPDDSNPGAEASRRGTRNSRRAPGAGPSTRATQGSGAYSLTTVPSESVTLVKVMSALVAVAVHCMGDAGWTGPEVKPVKPNAWARVAASCRSRTPRAR